MDVEKREKRGGRIEFKIIHEWDVVKKSIKDAYDKMERFAKTDGFRRGKIPRHILEVRFSQEAHKRAIEGLIEKSVEDVLLYENIKPLAGPWVSNVNFKDESPLSFNIEVEVMPSFEIPDYKNIKLSQKKIKIDDKEIDKHLEMLRREKREIKEKVGKIKKDDIAVVDLIAFPPSGKPIEYHGLYIEIGSGTFPEELERELIGMGCNDEKSFEVEMPADTEDKRLAGARVKFRVSVLSVKEGVLPNLDDDFAKRIGNFENIKALKERIKENLTKIEEEKEAEHRKSQIIDELFKRASFDVPESLVEKEYKEMLYTFFYNLKVKNITFERFLEENNKKEEEFLKELKKEAEKRTKVFLILERIAKLENISVSDIEYEEWVKRNFEEKAQGEALSQKKRERLKGELRREKTLDFLIK